MTARVLIDVPIEHYAMRYFQWREWWPAEWRSRGWCCERVEGDCPMDGGIEDGWFLDTFKTSIYKASQMAKIVRIIHSNPRAKYTVFFHDLWFPGIETLGYIRDLSGVDIKVAGYFHAGAYDITDLLGMTPRIQDWGRRLERIWCNHLIDQIYVGSAYHAKKLWDLGVDEEKVKVAGLPMATGRPPDRPSWESRTFDVVFPHRLTDDKGMEDFNYIRHALSVQGHDVTVTHDEGFSKADYIHRLADTKVIFSTANHENFGIGTMEAVMQGCHPVLPNRCVYPELYPADWLYDTPDEAVKLIETLLYDADDEFDGSHWRETYDWCAITHQVGNDLERLYGRG